MCFADINHYKIFFQLIIFLSIFVYEIKSKSDEEDYHENDMNAPHVSWVPIVSRRDEKIKEAFDVLIKSGSKDDQYIKKLNKIAEMLNVTYTVEDELHKTQSNSIRKTKSHQKVFHVIDENDHLKNISSGYISQINIKFLLKYIFLTYIYLFLCIY